MRLVHVSWCGRTLRSLADLSGLVVPAVASREKSAPRELTVIEVPAYADAGFPMAADGLAS